jgi:hypothetical protein
MVFEPEVLYCPVFQRYLRRYPLPLLIEHWHMLCPRQVSGRLYHAYYDFSRFACIFVTYIRPISMQHLTVDLWGRGTPRSQTSGLVVTLQINFSLQKETLQVSLT